MGTLALRVIGGAKRYHRGGRDEPVFENVHLDVEQGEVFALLGPSGCGKSTLLRAVAGLEPLSAGRVELGQGAERGGESRGGRAVGIVFQEPLLLPWLTVAENVQLGLRYRVNRRAAQVTAAVDQVLLDFGLSAVASAYPDELSGGQAQRAGLARTVVTQPALLLLDEPFAALDPRTRAGLQDWLLEVVRRRHLTVLLVTHDVEEALYVGDRVALMSPRPGTIRRIWDAGHADGAGRSGTAATAAGAETSTAASSPPGPRAVRQRDGSRLQAIRREILAEYQTDTPPGPAPSWVV